MLVASKTVQLVRSFNKSPNGIHHKPLLSGCWGCRQQAEIEFDVIFHITGYHVSVNGTAV
jgi:hypothetical protein